MLAVGLLATIVVVRFRMDMRESGLEFKIILDYFR